MAAQPQPGGNRKDQTVTYTGLFRLREWVSLAPLAIVGIVLGFWGFLECGDDCKVDGPIASAVKSIGLIRPSQGYSHPWQLVIAQIVMPALFLVGGAKLILLNIRRDVRVALARRQHDHTIVCGLSDSGRQIVENLRAAGGRVVAITLDADDPNAVACERLGVAVLRGDATQLSMLRFAGLDWADTVVITCGSDATNIEVALRVAAALDGTAERRRPWRWRFLPDAAADWVVKQFAAAPGERAAEKAAERSNVLRVLPEVRSAWLLELLQAHPTATLSNTAVETRPFDLAANAARLLLKNPVFGRYWRIARASPGAPALQPHLLIAGLGELGMQIIAQAVQTIFALPGCRLAVTVLDQQGESSAAELDARYPGIKDLIDRQFVPTTFAADKPAAWPAVWQAVEQALDSRPQNWTTLAVIVALSEDKDTLHTALQLRERLDKAGCAGTPVFARLREQQELGRFAASLDGADSLLDRLVPFGDLGQLTSPDLLIDERQDSLAHANHETYLAGGQGDPPSGEAARPWPELAERFKQSNRTFADHIPAKLAAVGLRVVAEPGPLVDLTGDVEAMSEVEHHRWMIERQTMGWSHGEERDAVARLHPDLIPWEKLKDGIREKDRDLVRSIPASLAAAKMSIRREHLIAGFGEGLAGAAAALDAVPVAELAVVIFDPRELGSWDFAVAAAGRGAKLWVLWREDVRKPLVTPEQRKLDPAFRAAIELAVSAREVAAMLAESTPTKPARKRAPPKS